MDITRKVNLKKEKLKKEMQKPMEERNEKKVKRLLESIERNRLITEQINKGKRNRRKSKAKYYDRKINRVLKW